jgi:hypothetical protein
MGTEECTVPEKILQTAADLEARELTPFSAETLVIAAWQQFPRTFGLKGYAEQYPDANKVLASLMGKKGLVSRGWLDKAGVKLYALTRQGRGIVRRLQPDGAATAPAAVAPNDPAAKATKVPTSLDALVQWMLGSDAAGKYRDRRQVEISFADACRFWGFFGNMDRMTDKEIHACLDGVTLAVNELDKLTAAGETVLSNGRVITAADADGLGEVHEYLKQRFSRHLTLLCNRKKGVA